MPFAKRSSTNAGLLLVVGVGVGAVVGVLGLALDTQFVALVGLLVAVTAAGSSSGAHHLAWLSGVLLLLLLLELAWLGRRPKNISPKAATKGARRTA